MPETLKENVGYIVYCTIEHTEVFYYLQIEELGTGKFKNIWHEDDIMASSLFDKEGAMLVCQELSQNKKAMPEKEIDMICVAKLELQTLKSGIRYVLR